MADSINNKTNHVYTNTSPLSEKTPESAGKMNTAMKTRKRELDTVFSSTTSLREHDIISYKTTIPPEFSKISKRVDIVIHTKKERAEEEFFEENPTEEHKSFAPFGGENVTPTSDISFSEEELAPLEWSLEEALEKIDVEATLQDVANVGIFDPSSSSLQVNQGGKAPLPKSTEKKENKNPFIHSMKLTVFAYAKKLGFPFLMQKTALSKANTPSSRSEKLEKQNQKDLKQAVKGSKHATKKAEEKKADERREQENKDLEKKRPLQ